MASALSCACGPPNTETLAYDAYTPIKHKPIGKHAVLDDDTDATTAMSESSEVLNQPYTRVTPLFRNIEKENWEGVLAFLSTGMWKTGFFGAGTEHMQSPGPEIQAKTWITSYDRKGNPEWSQLPLHAALSYSAPAIVVQKLIENYPKAVQCTDNEGMLPIHLAYGFGANDTVLSLLLETYPSSVNEKGLGGRYPYECCELGPNKVRGKVFKIIADQITDRVREETDKDWKDFVAAAQESIGIANADDVSSKSLNQVLLELLKDRKELSDIKRALRSKSVASPLARGFMKSAEKVPTPRSEPVSELLSPPVEKTSKRRGWGRKFK
ncbi:hypothetical protein FisN_4Hh200 [Fistulifera solaris]|uniref:Uncharacterized protein n=1 Tax=Fistulifera solaris TaxID=1519565 RepID=A0A1Z5K9S6_FISSO|nr:hypothetical protein FisN_4Hh200 [Fistulifera solaris]|eukprot:GAX22688.1 hypothetical protein FisN_4Hh200 [Fistulifera solaris]